MNSMMDEMYHKASTVDTQGSTPKSFNQPIQDNPILREGTCTFEASAFPALTVLLILEHRLGQVQIRVLIDSRRPSVDRLVNCDFRKYRSMEPSLKNI